MSFPQTRLRRLRMNPIMRNLVTETSLSVNDFIMPLFVCPGEKVKNPINSMPGNYQLSVDMLVEECRDLLDNGIKSVLLFGIPDHKDEFAAVASEPDGIVQRAIRALRKNFGKELLIFVDVCNCEYTTHGHCGIVINGEVDNDSTLEILANQSLSLAQAGADVIAPSDMMDGRIQRIRKELDDHGFFNVPILSYAAKFASAFYGPFREAAESAPKFGDRKSYQMNPANSDEAMREIALDIEEGADMVMVKPALSFLDIIHRAKMTFNMPLVAYNVSGEFAMIKAAAANGWIDEERIMMEVLTSIKRAGADIIITYFAKDAAKVLNRK
ncbi:MAG: porphobilinogen synthase [Microbacter sp.]